LARRTGKLAAILSLKLLENRTDCWDVTLLNRTFYLAIIETFKMIALKGQQNKSCPILLFGQPLFIPKIKVVIPSFSHIIIIHHKLDEDTIKFSRTNIRRRTD